MNILEIRPEQIICQVDGIITTLPNSPYYSLKYLKYDSRRIAYTFSNKSYVQETYDNRIFNCWCNGKHIQLRQDLSDNLAAAINHCETDGNVREYEELFNMALAEQPHWLILERYLNNIEDVKRTKQGFVIYDFFKIDYKGNAWVFHKDEDPQLDTWRSLCIVMQGHSDKSFLPNKMGEMVEVNALTMTILAKIIFLLNPDMKDGVFVNQLSEQLKVKLISIGEVNK